MATMIQQLRLAEISAYVPSASESGLETMREAFKQNRNRVYAFSFWSTDNEIEAEELMTRTFRRVFARSEAPTAEQVDQAFIRELSQDTTVGTLSLEVAPVTEVRNIRKNTMRVHLERAVMQLPITERLAYLMHDGEGYAHERVGKLLGLSVSESLQATHAARLQIRELVAAMR